MRAVTWQGTRDFDMTSLVSHRLTLDDAPDAYRMFCNNEDGCAKVVMKP